MQIMVEMKFIPYTVGLLLAIISNNAQADLNDFLTGQVVGNSIYMEYDHQGMLDSIDALNSVISSAQAAVSPAVSLFDMLYFQKGADLDGEASDDRSGDSVSLSLTVQLLPLGRGTTTVTEAMIESR